MSPINRLAIHLHHSIKHRCHSRSIRIPYPPPRHFHSYSTSSVISSVIARTIYSISMKHPVEKRQRTIASVRITTLGDIHRRSMVKPRFLVIVCGHTYDLLHPFPQHLSFKITIYLKQPIQHGQRVAGQRSVYGSSSSPRERTR